MITRGVGEPSQLASLGAFRSVRAELSSEYSILLPAEASNSLFRAIRICTYQHCALVWYIHRPRERESSWLLSFWCCADRQAC